MRLQKKKGGTKRCRFEAALFLLLLPLDVQQGKKKFRFLPLGSSSPRALYNQNRTPLAPPHDEKAEKSCLASDATIGHLSRRRSGAGDVRPMHGQRWDEAGSTPLPLPL